MKLPIPTSTPPMEAQSAKELPEGDDWQYEPKWDGFRCLAFRDGGEVELRSKSGQALGRYFPEVVSALASLPAKRFVLDGEIVVPVDGALSFDALLLRIHPAASRIARLSSETPARYLVFDLLVDDRGGDLTGEPLTTRRRALERFAKANVGAGGLVALSPATSDVALARRWLGGHAGTDGVVAKRVDLPYMSGDRTGMRKVKRIRTVDCVVGGFRYASRGRVVGSLLLGLYDAAGRLDHVGFTSGLSAEERKALTPKLERLAGGEGFSGRRPGGPSRWSTKRSTEWEPLRPELVVEVQYDHFTNGRFRHGTRFLRWRPEKAPRQCTMSQVTGTDGDGARAETSSGTAAAARRKRSPRTSTKARSSATTSGASGTRRKPARKRS